MRRGNRLTVISSSTKRLRNEYGRLPTNLSVSPLLCAGRGRVRPVLGLLRWRRKLLGVCGCSLRIGRTANRLVFVRQMLPGSPRGRHELARSLESGDCVLVVALLLISNSEMFPRRTIVSIQAVCFSQMTDAGVQRTRVGQTVAQLGMHQEIVRRKSHCAL